MHAFGFAAALAGCLALSLVAMPAASGAQPQACLDNADCRTGDVCVDRPAAQKGVCERACSWPMLKLRKTRTENTTVDGIQFVRYSLSISNWSELPKEAGELMPDSLFKAAPELPPCGSNANSSRSWLEIFNGDTRERMYGFCALSAAVNLETHPWVAVRAGTTPPTGVYVVLMDRKTSKHYCSNAAEISP
jgi:hypothetical protein